MSTNSFSSGSGPRAVWMPELTGKIVAANAWPWHGYIAPGALTLLTSQWKAGKTTLVSVLLERLGTGGMLAGLPVAPGRAVVVSEEAPEMWARRAERLDFGRHVCFLCRPFDHKPNAAEWEGLVNELDRLRVEHGLTLAVIDPLAVFLPGRDENNASAIITALMPLRRLTAAGMAVLLLHHPRKQGARDGMRSRGSGALAGHVDILIEMGWLPEAGPTDRRRRLRAFARFPETPPEHLIELNAAGTDYLSLGDAETEAFGRGWPGLRAVLTEADRRLSRTEILAAWSPDVEEPTPVTLWRWLERGVAEGRVHRAGRGTRSDPFCYWLPERAVAWEHGETR